MKLIIPLFAVVVIISLLAVACNPLGYISGSGPVVEKTYDYKDFNSIEISSAMEYNISQAANYSVKVTTRDNIQDYLDIHQSGKTLIVRLKPGSYTRADLRVAVTSPDLNKVEVSGASHGNIRGFKSTETFDILVSSASQADIDIESGNSEIEVSGASKVLGNLKAADLLLRVSGASRCTLDGLAQNADITASGASQIDFRDFHLKRVNIAASGASRADIYVDGELNMDISGASTLKYSGKPVINNINVSGASKIEKY